MLMMMMCWWMMLRMRMWMRIGIAKQTNTCTLESAEQADSANQATKQPTSQAASRMPIVQSAAWLASTT